LTETIREELLTPVTYAEHEMLKERVHLLEELVNAILMLLAAEPMELPEHLRHAAEELLVLRHLPALEDRRRPSPPGRSCRRVR
jgi:hypothetical protein